jgi:hypothetical protein
VRIPIKYLNSKTGRWISFLGVLNIIRLGLQIYLYKIGLVSVSADEFSRGIRAMTWANNPHINLFEDIQDTWLPFEKYLNGLALIVWPDVIKTPRATVFLASCIVIVFMFLIVYYLFKKFWLAVISTLLIAFQPWFTWLSGTPMLEMYCYALFFAGIYFLIVWLDISKKGFWALAGVCFLLASGFHYEGWVYVNIVMLLTLPSLIFFLKKKQIRQCLELIGLYFLSNAFILFFTVIGYLQSGVLFSFLAAHTNYSKWYYSGYNMPLWGKFFYYWQLIISNSTLLIWIPFVIAFFFLWKNREFKRIWLILCLGLISLLANSIANIFSVPATAAPGRYSLFYIIIILLFIAYGIYYLYDFIKRVKNNWLSYFGRILTILLCILILGWAFGRIPEFRNGMPKDTIAVGDYLNQKLANDGSKSKFMVQLVYWDYLGVELSAGHFNSIVFDRIKDIYDRNTVSIFNDNPQNIIADLSNENVRYIALKDMNLKQKAQTISLLEPLENIGNWTIYQFNAQ